MALARYKDLCIDVNDGPPMAEFWAGAFGLTVGPDRSDHLHLVGSTPQHVVWLNEVPEPRTVKQRVHVDVHARSVAEIERLGATVLPEWGPFAWTVMADPEGGEFCVFEREEPPAERFYELGIDATDSGPIATWWAEAFAAELNVEADYHSVESIPGCPWESFVFITVPEPKTVKNRIHWDVLVDDEAAITELCTRGAVVLRERDAEIGWTVMADPEGNEFCAFVDRT